MNERGFSILNLAILIIVSVIVWDMIAEVRRPIVCVEYHKIVEIGGCERYGLCGVKLDDGSKAYENLPIIGQEICTKRIRQELRAR